MALDYGRRIPVDPRVVEQIQRSPEMRYEQGEAFMSGWGGPTMYQQFAKLPVNERVIFYAVRAGLQTAEQISINTDLSVKQVESALTRLEKEGFIKLEVTAIEL